MAKLKPQYSNIIFRTFVVSLFIFSWSTCFADEVKVVTDGAVSDTSNGSNPSYSSADGIKNAVLVNSTEGGNHSDHKDSHSGHHSGHHTKGLVVASWNYHEIRDPFIFTVVLILAGICKVGYHHAGILSSRVPESCVLILFGTVFGAIIHFSGAKETFPNFFDPHEFFVFLLPPIILEAAFSLHDRAFIENIGSILLFAVVGTILACVFVGLSLFGLAKAGAMGPIEEMGFVELMVFASLIVAVDPVAVLAVFNEIGVNNVLYFLVFGESLLNDGVTVVLYKVFQAYNVMDEITGTHIVIGIVKFFVVCFGGLLLGVLAGVGAAVLTKHSTHVKVAQPLIIYAMAYLGFLLAELFEFSGIISLVACGITLKQYAFSNISEKSRTTIDYFTKVISTACETIIFMFLGLSMVTDNHVWHTGFTLWTIILCDFFRFLITFGLSFLINKLDIYRVRKITLDEQFMIAYGGLRGAVCFSLVALLSPVEFPRKDMFVTTTLALIIFTVFIQGITIKPLVYLFQVTLAPEKDSSMYQELHEHVTDHLMAGIEDIIGDHGKNHLREKMTYLDQHYIQPLLVNNPDPCDVQLMEFYNKLVLKEHYDHLQVSNVQKAEEMPKLPHVATELFLRGILKAPDSDGAGMETKSMATKEETKRSSQDEVTLRHPGGAQRSLSAEGKRRSTSSSGGQMNPHGLRVLLRQTTNSHLAKHDRNLTGSKLDFNVEVSKKLGQNRQMRGLSSLVVGNRPALATQLSWSDSDNNVCRQRKNSHELAKQSVHRRAATMDIENHGCQATLEPLDGFPSAGVGVDLSVPPTSPLLDSVHEVDEEKESKSDDELLGVEDEEVDEEVRMKRSGRRSTKHKLERQGGLDSQMGGPPSSPHSGDGETVPLGDLNVRVDTAGQNESGEYSTTSNI